MRYIKYCSILLTILLSMTLTSNINKNTSLAVPKNIQTKSETKSLSDEELKKIFPDASFRNVVKRNFKNEEITIDKIQNLKGEFYATGENIKNLTGISYLKNIESFVFWNNNIRELPEEILSLYNIKYINLANNYITENEVVDNLIEKGVDVNCDLNFIKDKPNQYKLISIYNKLELNKSEEICIGKLLNKYIYIYDKYWEVVNEMPKNLKYEIAIDDENVVKVYEDYKLKAASPGKCRVKISLDDRFYEGSTAIIDINVID